MISRPVTRSVVRPSVGSVLVSSGGGGGFPALSIADPTFPESFTYNAAITSITDGVATGGSGSYTYSIFSGTAPTGLTLNSSTGAWTGTPTVAEESGTFIEKVVGGGTAYTNPISWAVGEDLSLQIATPIIPQLQVDKAMTPVSAGTASGGTGSYTYSLVGDAIAGVSIHSTTGLFTGTPTTADTGSFVVQVNDGSTTADSDTIDWEVIEVAHAIFDGSTGYLNTVDLALEDFTISVWVNSDAFEAGTNQALGGKFAADYIRFSGTTMSFRCDGDTGTGSLPEHGMSDDEWYHLCVTRGTDGDIRIYVDGVVNASIRNIAITSVFNFNFSGQYNGIARYSGLKRRERTFDRELTPDEVLFEATEGLSGTDPTDTDLLVHLPLHEDADDISGNGNDATVVGGVTFSGTVPDEPEPLYPPNPTLEATAITRLKSWATSVAAGGTPMPISNHWENLRHNPTWNLSKLKQGALILPTFRVNINATETQWDADSGYTGGAQDLAEYCEDNDLPICIRSGNIEDYASTTTVRELGYDDSPLIWYSDWSGNSHVAEVATTSGGTYTPSSSPASAGDFFTVSGLSGTQTATLGSSNPKTVRRYDRIVAAVDSPDVNDGDDWEVTQHYLSYFCPVANWEALADGYASDMLTRMGTEITAPPFVLFLINNEYPQNIVQTSPNTFATDHRLDDDYPGLTKTYASSPPNRMEFSMILRKLRQPLQAALTEAVRDELPTAWQSVTKFVAYNSLGCQAKLGLRAKSGAPDIKGWDSTGDYSSPDVLNGDQDTEYGLEYDMFDGGSVSVNSAKYDETLKSNYASLNWIPRIVEDYSKTNNSNWFQGWTPYATSLVSALAAGNGYMDPDRFGAAASLMCFLCKFSINNNFLNNNNYPTDVVISESNRTLYSISEVHTHDDYFDALDTSAKFFWDTASLVTAMGWDLDMNVAGDVDDPWEFSDEGDLAGSLYLLDNTDCTPSDATNSDTAVYTVCRRNGSGNGMIFAWAPAGETTVNVTTTDGSKTVTARVNGSFWSYTSSAIAEVT